MELPDPFPPLTKAGGEVEEMETYSQQVVEPSAGSLLTFPASEELFAARTLHLQAWGCLTTTAG